MDFREREYVTVDCLLFGLGENGLNILLKKRYLNMFNESYPVINDWIITGGHTLISRTLEESANIIFNQITRIKNDHKIQFRTYGKLLRSKSDKDLLWIQSRGLRKQAVTIAYYVLLPLDRVELISENFQWFSLKSLPELGFDHGQLIKDIYEDLKRKIMSEPVIFNSLDQKFTLNELQTAFESVLDITLDNRNFRKKILKKTYIVPLPEKRKGVSKKPSKLYMYSHDVYEKVKEQDFIINI